MIEWMQKRREKVLAYKRAFKGDNKEVLFDLMNKYYLNPIRHKTEIESHRAEGARTVVCYILEQLHINIEDLDKMMNGEQE